MKKECIGRTERKREGGVQAEENGKGQKGERESERKKRKGETRERERVCEKA